MATEKQTRQAIENMINRISDSLKSHLNDQGNNQKQSDTEKIEHALRRQMSKNLNDQRLNRIMYSYFKLV